jgi:hypothetical protein
MPLEAVIGRTFDVTLIVYPEQPPLRWREPVLWAPTKFNKYDVIIGSDGRAYMCLIENHAINPVGDTTGSWEYLAPENISGWTGLAHVNGVALTSPSSGVTLGGTAGTVRVELKPAQSEDFIAGEHPWDLSLTDTEGHDYEYVKGPITWAEL